MLVLTLFCLVLLRAQAQGLPSERYGWQRAESVALVQVSGAWTLRQVADASQGGYHASVHNGATLRYPFRGDAIRVGYRVHRQGGRFTLLLDGRPLAALNSAGQAQATQVSETFQVSSGYHVLDIVTTLPGDDVTSVGIDYIEVFNGPPLPTIQPTATATPTAQATALPTQPSESARVELLDVQLLAAPATPTPTPTPRTPTEITVSVLVGIDLNANRQLEPNEGVQNLSIRAVRAADNTLLASALTDSVGFARIRALSDGDIVLLIPLLGAAYPVRVRGAAVQDQWTFALQAANVPGLIP